GQQRRPLAPSEADTGTDRPGHHHVLGPAPDRLLPQPPLARRPYDRAHVRWLLEFLAALCPTAMLAVLLVVGDRARAIIPPFPYVVILLLRGSFRRYQLAGIGSVGSGVRMIAKALQPVDLMFISPDHPVSSLGRYAACINPALVTPMPQRGIGYAN